MRMSNSIFSCEHCIHNGVCGFEETFGALVKDVEKIVDEKYQDKILGCTVVCNRFSLPMVQSAMPYLLNDSSPYGKCNCGSHNQVNYRELREESDPSKGVWTAGYCDAKP